MSDYKHLDSEYRKCWETFLLSNGILENSREKNWRDVEWEKVTKITAYLQGKEYSISSDDKKDFAGFLNFRNAGLEAQYDEDKKYIGHKTIHEWVIGWMDKENAYLTTIDFYTGNCLSENVQVPIDRVKNHIHPRLSYKGRRRQ